MFALPPNHPRESLLGDEEENHSKAHGRDEQGLHGRHELCNVLIRTCADVWNVVLENHDGALPRVVVRVLDDVGSNAVFKRDSKEIHPHTVLVSLLCVKIG